MNFYEPDLSIGVEEEQAWQVIQYADFSYGLDVMTSIDNLDPRALRTAKNIILERSGGFKKRDGTTYAGSTGGYSTGGALKRIFDFERWGGDVFKLNASGARLKLEGTTELTTGLANANLHFTPMIDYCYFVNGDKYYRTNGKSSGTTTVAASSGSSSMSAVKRCSGLATYRSRMYAYGDPESPHSLYYSQLEDPGFFKDADRQINLLSSNASKIVRCEPFLSGLAILRQSGAYTPGEVWALFNDPTDTTNRSLFKIVAEEGPCSGRAVALVGDMLAYPGRRNVYGLKTLDKDNPSSVRLGDAIASYIRNAYNKQNMCAIGHDGKYYLAFQQYSTSTCNDSVLVLDTLIRIPNTPWHQGAWVLWEGIYVNDWLARDGVLHYADALSTSGHVKKFADGVYNDVSEVITMDVETGLLRLLGNEGRQFVLRMFLRAPQPLIASNVSITAVMEYQSKEWDVDLQESFVWGNSVWGKKWGWTDLIRKSLPVGFFGDRLQVRFQNNTVDEPCHIYGFGAMVLRTMPWATEADVTEV